MHILITIFIGFLAGLVARWITPGSGPSGFILTTVLGIAVPWRRPFSGNCCICISPDSRPGSLAP
ncbi:hypothetical protein LMG10661_00391 [Ralstonia syzygii subsp. syzygii]|nr:hypothetical protein LMG10661_00391 [Ralstonia syzygii subsp. syzygii]